MTRTVLLTGATGFVGRQVLRALAHRGCSIRVVVREGAQPRLERVGARVDVWSTPDLFAEDVSFWARACEGVDTVVHVAWYAEPGQYLLSPRNLDCLEGTLRLARGAALAGVRRFVGVGTCFEYDLASGTVSVDTPLRPTTPYAAAKASAFWMLSQWLPTQSVSFAWARLFYLHGEGEDPRRLVPYVRARLAAREPAELTSGAQIRDFLDVSEAGEQLATLALGDVSGAVNVCSGIGITVRALATRIAEEIGRPDLLRFGARPDHPVDPPCVVGVPGGRPS